MPKLQPKHMPMSMSKSKSKPNPQSQAKPVPKLNLIFNLPPPPKYGDYNHQQDECIMLSGKCITLSPT